MLIFGPCIFPLMILPNQHVENDIIFNCCIAEWYLNLPNAIDKHLGSLKSFVITKQSLKYIFVYMSEYICSRIVELKGICVCHLLDAVNSPPWGLNHQS